MTKSDLISREAAIEAIQTAYCTPCKERGDDHNEVRCRACEFDDAMSQIDSVPSAEAEQVTGKLKKPCDSLLTGDSDECKEQKSKLESAEAVHGEWVRKYDDKVNCYWYECDQCGEYRPRNQFGYEYNANYCPNCGARMKGGDPE